MFQRVFGREETSLFKKFFKPDINLFDQPFPINFSLFNEETQCIVTLLSQFLGIDNDKYIIEPLMTVLFVLSTFPIDSDEPS